MYDSLDSYYIKPFLGKNNQALIEEIRQHENHQSPLDAEQKRMEGQTNPYKESDYDYIGRR
ncbi:MAG: hypothetical protein ACE5RC_00065 [Nitrosopumilus sp.]